MPTRSTASAIWTWVAAIGLVAILSLLWTFRGLLTTSGSAIAEGRRPLVVVSVGGAPKNAAVHVISDVTESSMEMFFYVTADDVDYKKNKSLDKLDVRITFAGLPADSRVTCGESTVVEPVEFAELATGARYAIEVDALGGPASAIAHEASSTTGSSKSYLEADYYVHRAEMWLPWSDSEIPNGRWVVTNETGTEFLHKESCTIPPESVWFIAEDSPRPIKELQRSLLLPQINATEIKVGRRGPAELLTHAWIDRDGDTVLVEAYPPPDVEDGRWGVSPENHTWASVDESKAPFQYSGQPTMVFRDRSFDDYREIALLGAGVLLGLAGSMATELVRAAVRALAGRRAATGDGD
ncbi:hypothetical protein [Promicromonospora sp. NPDC060271]|uniref:hypothetical protein n=1 Tax=Promicromonospora sp. NPDC060271 TaxID=3347089 RepID=UPI00364B3716